uniref:GRAM domain-containing protein 1B isoform X14 n=1 Tax=Callorhinus ursinus TaxID=34884 RepID=A0A3Q7S6T0_CALUR|nr:GRAM domain-containing protein 1B isoform X14 [Callorhinus ursinus]
MPAANMLENLQPPALQVPEPQGAPEGSPLWSSSSTPTLRRRRFKMRRMKNVQEQSLEAGLTRDLPGVLAPGKEFLQLPSIEITPSSDEDTPWSNCSTPSASPRRKRFLLRKWLRVRERKECSESSSQQSSHDDDSSRFLSPRAWEERWGREGTFCWTVTQEEWWAVVCSVQHWPRDMRCPVHVSVSLLAHETRRTETVSLLSGRVSAQQRCLWNS